MVFVLEALVFILIGFSLRGVLDRVGGVEARAARGMAPILAGIVLAVTLARFVWVFGSDALLAGLRKAGLIAASARSAGARPSCSAGRACAAW